MPDDSELPDWNNSPELDDVTWESLPVVLREVRRDTLAHGYVLTSIKRNIHYSSISLRPVPKFAELHAAVIRFFCLTFLGYKLIKTYTGFFWQPDDTLV